MKLEFESIEEVKEFVTKLKGTRGGKAGDKDDEAQAGAAPAPLAPPITGATAFNPGGFAPPVGGAGQPGGAFPAAGAAVLAPEVQALVNRVVVRIDGAIASGQPADQVLAWFRNECAKGGVDATNATMDQIKAVLLSKLSVPSLENIAKLMNA